MIFYELYGSPWKGLKPHYKPWYTDREAAKKNCRAAQGEVGGDANYWDQPCVLKVELEGSSKDTTLAILNGERVRVTVSRELIYPRTPELVEHWNELLRHEEKRRAEINPTEVANV